MKNNFKKVILLCTALAMNLTSYAISTGGAVAAGFGAAAAVSLLGWGISKSHKNRKNRKKEREENITPSHSYKRTKDESQRITTRAAKRNLKHQIRDNKKEIKQHRLIVKKLEKKGKGSTPEAADHRTMISKLENLVTELKRELESL